jgi:hypothetical protein
MNRAQPIYGRSHHNSRRLATPRQDSESEQLPPFFSELWTSGEGGREGATSSQGITGNDREVTRRSPLSRLIAASAACLTTARQ